MQNLDRLGWAAGFGFRVHGLRVGVRVNDAELLKKLDWRLPPGAAMGSYPVVDRLYSLRVAGEPKGRIRPFHLAYDGIVLVGRSHDLDEVLEEFEANVRIYVAERAHRRIFVHAGVVEVGGRAVILPGRTYSGKSALVEALVKAGATYYSDEFAVIDGRGRVHPFPKVLSLRPPGEMRGQRVPVEAIGGRAGERAVPVGMIVSTRYKAGGRFRPRAMTPGQAVLELFKSTVAARRSSARALAALRQVALETVALRGPRGEAAEAAAEVMRRMAELT